jgi:hypothetical protein
LVFLKNFTSELSLEILATVDFILAERPDSSVEEVINAIAKWNIRKKELFKPDSIARAYEHLQSYKKQLIA